jgi:hypothetical protein
LAANLRRREKAMTGSDPVFTLTVMGTLFLVAWVILMAARQRVSGLSDFGQGLLGIASLFALLAAAWLYFLEGRAKPRHEVSAVGTVVPLAPDKQGMGRVLVQLAGTLINRGVFPVEYECIGVDVRGFKPGEAANDERFKYDILSQPLAKAVKTMEWMHCMKIEEHRWYERQERYFDRRRIKGQRAAEFRPPDSGLRYPPLTLEAGESRTLDYEIVVPCEYAAVRLHFMVPKPHSDSAPEAKAVLSLIDPCRASVAGARQAEPRPAAGATRVEFGASTG